MTAAHFKEVKFALNVASAIFGLMGSWLLSRRYAKPFWRSVLFACIAPFLYVFGQGARTGEFIDSTVAANKDIPESASEIALGLALLFLAFLLQLGSTFLDLAG